MSYLYSKGKRLFGDLEFEDDTDTQIDFDEDYIALVAGGNAVLAVSGSKVGIGTDEPDYTLDVAGNIGLDEYIYHNGDSNTYIRFQNDDINLQVGGTSMIKLDKGNNVVKINNANQNIDFKIKDNNSDVLFHADAGDARIGIGTDSPTQKLDINSNSIRIRNTKTPLSASDFGVAGEICWDANYLYICVATDTWKRIPLETW